MFISFFLYCCLFLLSESKLSSTTETCLKNPSSFNGSIGVVIDQRSRVGREQKIAMEMAVHDLHHLCSNLVLHFKDYSYGNSAATAAMDIVSHIQLHAVIGTITQQEAALLSDFKKVTGSTPIISISPITQQMSPKFASFIQMSSRITYQMQSIAAIIAYFKWKKVISIHEQCNGFSAESITQLSDSLREVGSSIERHLTLPCISSLLDPKKTIEQELKKLISTNVNIFVLGQSSLEFATILFEKANEFGMMEKGYGWIVPDEISNLIDSLDLSILSNMQGVIGLQTDYVDMNEPFRKFKSVFRRKFNSKYPEEDNSSPSIYALRAYDAILTVAKAMHRTEKTNGSVELLNRILMTDFEGLSGEISFKNGLLSQKPIFRIVNVIGKSYREVGFWSPEFGFRGDLAKNLRFGSGLIADMNSIYWPGGLQTVPKGWTMGSIDKPLRIGIPAKGAFDKFVKVTYEQNQTFITGFSIEVFEAALKKLPYNLQYVFVPYMGSYDEMVAEVHNKNFDAAVGDTEIMADRYVYAEFTQPYMDSGLVMVVTAKPSLKESKFFALNAFTKEMWVILATCFISTGTVIWLTEYATRNENETFKLTSIHEVISSILWLSVTVISLSQKEHLKQPASRVVATAYVIVIFVVGACFTAVLSTMMTVPRLQPSVQDIDFLRNSNAVVGCNGNSFIVRYLIDVLRFKPPNVKKINSIDEYPEAFKKGDIKAAFFVAPHAKVFLAKYCKGYIISGRSFKLGGFGFVIQKGNQLASDISEAILKVTQSGEINALEDEMLRSFSSNCSSTNEAIEDNITLDSGPLSGLFQILGGIVGFTFLYAIYCSMKGRWSNIDDLLVEVRIIWRIIQLWPRLVLDEFRERFGLVHQRDQQNIEMNVINQGETYPNLVAIHSI